MGLDKLREVTGRRPGVAWFDQINADYRQSVETRRFNYTFRFKDRAEVDHISQDAEVRIWTKPGVSPQYMVELNFIAPGGAQAPMTIFETNPNNFDCGWAGLEELAEEIFTLENLPDLKNTRMDFNAEVVDVSVHYFRDALQVPMKRTKNEEVKFSGQQWDRADIETFYVGKNPARLRVYDKIQEMIFRKEDVSKLPKTLTRLEWELRGVRCPIEKFLDIPKLLPDCRPFAALQLTETPPDYLDFKLDTPRSLSLFLYRNLAEKFGAHQARRILNKNRNYARQFKEILICNAELKRSIEESFQKGNERLLSGRGASIAHVYVFCALCQSDAPGVAPCAGCGVRFCPDCRELSEGHDRKCLEEPS